MNSFALPQAIRALMPQAKAELAELVAYRSVADPLQFPREECEKAAGWIVETMKAEGMQDVMLIDTPDGTQSVYGYLPGPEGAPTVLLYAHYDVQPPLEEAAWVTPPFELTEREDGRWYGRGAADCKGGLIMHLTALRALRATGPLPVTVKIIVEGSEEQATGGLQRYVEAHPELLIADAVVIGDSGNFRAGLPSVTASLRGVSVIEVSVNTLKGDLHSGQFGGAAPDALAALVRMLDSLMDEDGNTAIDGLPSSGTWDGLEYTEDAFREDARMLDGVALRGNGPIADRVWARHALTILGIECPGVTGWTPSVQSSAKAVVGLRVAPGTDAAVAETALVNHLKSAAPWGACVSTKALGQGQPFQADITSPAYTAMADAMRTAYGRDMVVMGHGGSIPLCNTLQAVYPEAEILLIGLSDPQAQIHAVNESVDPAELESMSLTEALYLRGYAENFSSSLPTREHGRVATVATWRLE